MTNPQIPNSVTTGNGTYYVGMTKKDAEDKGIYKKSFGIDYKDLDKDESGVLDQREILEGIKKQAGRDVWTHGISASIGGMLASCATIFEIPSLGTTTTLVVCGAYLFVNEGDACERAKKQEKEAQKHLDALY